VLHLDCLFSKDFEHCSILNISKLPAFVAWVECGESFDNFQPKPKSNLLLRWEREEIYCI